MEPETTFAKIKSSIITITAFLFPLFFFPLTQEFFLTNKFYLLNLVALLLICLSALEVFLVPVIKLRKNVFNIALISFMLAMIVSTFLISPNPVQALLNPNFNLLTIASLIIFYLHAVRTNVFKTIISPLLASSVIVALASLLFLLVNPFQSVNLPFYLQFLKNSTFTTIGTQIDLAIFLGFIVVLIGSILYDLTKHESDTNKSIYILILLLNAVALITVVYFIYKNQLFLSLTPMKLSWYAGLEILKNPLTALFGAGVDNFSSVFTRVKDLAYNQSPQWQIGSFTVARSTFLHILTETGLVGLATFLLIVAASIKQLFNQDSLDQNFYKKAPFIFILIAMAFFPPSPVVFFLFFVSLTFVFYPLKETATSSYNIRKMLAGAILIAFGIIFGSIVSLYFLGKFYLADYHIRKSIEGVMKNDLHQLYDNQRMAIILNPRIEAYRVVFSQTNAILARNIANKTSAQSGTTSAKLTDQDKQIIAQAIQAAISEAKAAVALNPQKANYWDNLASIYRSIINVATDANTWTISSYQRAIVLDPQNPVYRLNLGGVYFSLGNYDNALTLFQQAASLKPNWSNAYYNLAWASYQKKDYQKAITEMEQAIRLLDPASDKVDYDKAMKELTQFKARLTDVAGASTDQPSPSDTPTPPTATSEPKIKLPQGFSPESLQ